MTKEITKANILQELQDKFKLREFEPDKFLFSETVVPTYEIEQHLEVSQHKTSLVSITSAAGFVFFTVPENERWTIRAYTFIFYNVGAYKVSGAYVTRKATPAATMYLDLKKGQTDSYLVNFFVPGVLEPGDSLSALIDTYVSTANLLMTIDCIVEELR